MFKSEIKRSVVLFRAEKKKFLLNSSFVIINYLLNLASIKSHCSLGKLIGGGSLIQCNTKGKYLTHLMAGLIYILGNMKFIVNHKFALSTHRNNSK